jgi:DNA-binding transcriptional ArsR family regulator
MDAPVATAVLAALGNARRLQVFRLLVRAGPTGVAAGEIARRLDVLQNTLSSSLSVLSHAGLVTSRREGRSIIYSAAYPRLGELVDFLVRDCCAEHARLCGPLVTAASVAPAGACC